MYYLVRKKGDEVKVSSLEAGHFRDNAIPEDGWFLGFSPAFAAALRQEPSRDWILVDDKEVNVKAIYEQTKRAHGLLWPGGKLAPPFKELTLENVLNKLELDDVTEQDQLLFKALVENHGLLEAFTKAQAEPLPPDLTEVRETKRANVKQMVQHLEDAEARIQADVEAPWMILARQVEEEMETVKKAAGSQLEPTANKKLGAAITQVDKASALAKIADSAAREKGIAEQKFGEADSKAKMAETESEKLVQRMKDQKQSIKTAEKMLGQAKEVFDRREKIFKQANPKASKEAVDEHMKGDREWLEECEKDVKKLQRDLALSEVEEEAKTQQATVLRREANNAKRNVEKIGKRAAAEAARALTALSTAQKALEEAKKAIKTKTAVVQPDALVDVGSSPVSVALKTEVTDTDPRVPAVATALPVELGSGAPPVVQPNVSVSVQRSVSVDVGSSSAFPVRQVTEVTDTEDPSAPALIPPLAASSVTLEAVDGLASGDVGKDLLSYFFKKHESEPDLHCLKPEFVPGWGIVGRAESEANSIKREHLEGLRYPSGATDPLVDVNFKKNTIKMDLTQITPDSEAAFAHALQAAAKVGLVQIKGSEEAQLAFLDKVIKMGASGGPNKGAAVAFLEGFVHANLKDPRYGDGFLQKAAERLKQLDGGSPDEQGLLKHLQGRFNFKFAAPTQNPTPRVSDGTTGVPITNAFAAQQQGVLRSGVQDLAPSPKPVATGNPDPEATKNRL